MTKAQLIDAEMEVIAWQYLRVVAIAFCIFYLLRGLSYLFMFPPEVSGLLGWPALLSAGLSALVLLLQITGRLPKAAIGAVMVGVGVSLIFNVFWNLYLTADTVQFTNACFAIIAFGLGTLSAPIWLAQVVVCLMCYFYALDIMGLDTRIYTQIAVSAVTLSAVSFFLRAPTIRRRVELQLELEEKARHLERANKAKDRFVANMSHELRTPLTGVLGMMDLLRDTRLDREQTQFLDTARTSADFLLGIINDVLDYSKLDAGKIKLKPAPLDVRALTENLASMMREQAERKAISLTLDLPKDPVPVSADAVRVGQVLYNLVGNAIKFTEVGGVTVSLEAKQHANKTDLCWQVRDTGAGIPQNRIARLFERFEQADASETRNQVGTGLGLAIIRELLALMGGDVTVDSKIGHGTTFSVTLSFDSVPLSALVSEQDGLANKDQPEKAQTGPLYILLAEDNRVNQMLVSRLLEAGGWEVKIVQDGEAAVAAATKSDRPFDLVLMDVQMPVLDGVSAARIIRASMKSPPPIIALTANTMRDDVERYLAAGMDAHVAKPIDRKLLYETIGTVMQRKAD